MGYVKYIIKRLLWLIPVVLGVALLIFTLLYFVPGDPATTILGSTATEAQKEALRESMGLNDPYIIQLGRFFKDTFLHFDFGQSYFSKQAVSSEILMRLPYTLIICYVGIVIAVILGIPLGVFASVNQNTWKDNLAMLIAMVGVSMPGFWFSLIMIMFFAMKLGWVPVSGVTTFKGWILPCVASSFSGLSMISRQMRSSMVEMIRQDYITTARAKGQTEFKVIMGHAFRNALIPVITTVGGMMAGTLGGTVVIENIFSIPGIGSYLISGISNRDYPVVRGTVIVLAVVFALMSLLVDLVYGAVDPRMRIVTAKKKKKKTASAEQGV